MRGLRTLCAVAALALGPAVAMSTQSIASAASAAPAVPANCALQRASVVCSFAYNGTNGADGSVQHFTVPAGVSSVTIEAWGAQGGGAGGSGGPGGHAKGTLPVAPGTVLAVRVGGQGGFNGGGAGTAPGGGASDVRIGSDALGGRVIVAGGGGGAGHFRAAAPGLDLSFVLRGGTGGGASGGDGVCEIGNGTSTVHLAGCGGGATATTGGAAGSATSACGAPPVTVPARGGALGQGGDGGSVVCDVPIALSAAGAGGGGGYFGGGGGAADVALFPLTSFGGAGGGGSGFVSARATGVVDEAGVRDGNGLVTIEYARTPSSKDACRDGGWRNLVDGNAAPFRNQGQCVAWAVHFLR